MIELVKQFKNTIPFFWVRFWLLLGGIQALLVGFLLFFRYFYFTWFNLLLPSPRLYGDISSAFLITIGLWLIYSAYKIPYTPELWIIPAGSALGRSFYFSIASIGYLTGSNHVIYLLLGFSDIFFAIILSWVAIVMKKQCIPVNSANKSL